MAYTTMKTWGSETLTSSDMKTYLTDNIEYLKGVSDGLTFSGVTLTRVAATSIPDAATTDISWVTESEDSGGWWSSGASITVPAGAIPSGFTTIKLLVTARATWDNNGTGVRKLLLTNNGTSFAAPVIAGITGEDIGQDVTDFVSVVSGDVIKLQVYQNSGGALDISNLRINVVRFAPVS